MYLLYKKSTKQKYVGSVFHMVGTHSAEASVALVGLNLVGPSQLPELELTTELTELELSHLCLVNQPINFDLHFCVHFPFHLK